MNTLSRLSLRTSRLSVFVVIIASNGAQLGFRSIHDAWPLMSRTCSTATIEFGILRLRLSRRWPRRSTAKMKPVRRSEIGAEPPELLVGDIDVEEIRKRVGTCSISDGIPRSGIEGVYLYM